MPIFLAKPGIAQTYSPHDLHFTNLSKTWDEGIPLGNGMLGALVWQKDSALRISLDRADLWDLRPVNEFSLSQFSFQWVIEQVKKNAYDIVQQLFDLPYERDPAPTRIPAGALEIADIKWGTPEHVHLSIDQALCEIKWSTGTIMKLFVDANQPLGWFLVENLHGVFKPRFCPPKYHAVSESKPSGSVDGQDLQRLGYSEGHLETDSNSIYFKQSGWGNFYYEVSVRWRTISTDRIEGVWSITTNNSPFSGDKSAWTLTHDALDSSFEDAFLHHSLWWKNYWEESSINIPDTLLENQYYREMYKFGSASRKGTPPITLQAIWTADNGHLPPWKGDLHHDLNTELSYWPGYTSNHLEESAVFTDWLWRFRGEAETFSKNYFGHDGNNFPGVSTLTGQPMGGWIQYAFSPTTSAWLAHHFYMQWKYSMDTTFLTEKAYPFLKKMALFIDELSVKEGKYRRLPLSSSPEFDDNSINAWHTTTTNYDLALIRWLYQAGSEMAESLGEENESFYWLKKLKEWPDLALSKENSLMIAPGYPYRESHRHFSHLMAIYPLGIIAKSNSRKEEEIVKSSLDELQKYGPDYWCGYSWAWLGSLKARSLDGEG
ncbi:MAG: hypothetical protein WCL00_03115, partial [Bacteroidota bacterium]